MCRQQRESNSKVHVFDGPVLVCVRFVDPLSEIEGVDVVGLVERADEGIAGISMNDPDAVVSLGSCAVGQRHIST